MNNGIPSYNGSTYPVATPSSNYPFYTQPMYAPPNMPMYPNLNTAGSFADPTCSVTPFVRWIKDCPLSDGLKMPSHIGSYDGKGDLGNLLHLFERAIRMRKWLMPVACHMYTYTLKDSARIWWNIQKSGSILNYEDLKAKFQSHFSQQKKFTKTHLAVHNIKQRECESTRSFATRYTDDTLQILGLHEDQRIFSFVHGLRTKILVEHLSTNLPSTYKGLMEKTYTWVEAREVATTGAPNDRKEYFERSKKSFEDNNKGKVEGDYCEVGEITFPPLPDMSSADPVIIKAYVSGRQVNRVYLDSESSGAVVGPSEVTNSAGTLQTTYANASEEEDEAEELIVVPTEAKHTAAKVGPRKSSTNSKAEEFLTELQNLKTQEKEAYPTGISEDTPEILAFRRELDELAQKHLREVPKNKATSTTLVNSGSGPVNSQHADQDDSDMPELTIFNKPQKGIFDEASYDDEGMVYDFNNLPTEVAVSPIPTLRIHNIHPQSQILGDPKSSVQTRSRVQQHSGVHALVSDVQKQQRNNHKDQQHCLFACFLSQEEPKKISEALKDDSWVEAMQEELLQFRLQQVWILVDLPHGAKVIGKKWVYRNKRDEREVVVRNKARLVAQDEEVYVSQPPGFVDLNHLKKVYKVVKALYGLHQAPRAWYATLSTFLKTHGYRRGTIDKTLFIKKDKKDIMLVQVYVDDIIFGSTRKSWCDEFEALMKGIFQMNMLKKFDLASVKTAITPMETKMALKKDEEANDVDVTPKTSHLNVVKRIFKYLKGKPNLGLWYPRESPFDLEAYSDSDYAEANLDRKSTTGGFQFLGRRLISWQCKKQTIVATSTTEAEYVAAASCSGQVLWIQNQMLDYSFNFMNTKIHIDNESTICIVKNPVYHSKIKHIEIRHHFIRDSNERKLIKVLKIHTDFNVVDLLTKAFDGPRFNFLVDIQGLQKNKSESARSDTEEDVEAYMDERVDEPSSEEF
ncbi:putative ribonuclease H-like domain-containing protein [Tanacetum coccineum]